MDTFDDFMKQAFTRQELTARREPGPDCPGEEALARYIDGGGTEEDRACVEGHLARCGYCLDTMAIHARTEAGTGAVPALSTALSPAEGRIFGELPGAADREPEKARESTRPRTWDRLFSRARLVLDDLGERFRIAPRSVYGFATVAAAAVLCLVVLTRTGPGPHTGPGRLDLQAFGVPQASVRGLGDGGHDRFTESLGENDYLRIDIPFSDPPGHLTGLFIDRQGALIDVAKVKVAEKTAASFTFTTDRREADVNIDIGETSVLMEVEASVLLGDHHGPVRILFLSTGEPLGEGRIETLVREAPGAGSRPERWMEVVGHWEDGTVQRLGLDEIDYRTGG